MLLPHWKCLETEHGAVWFPPLALVAVTIFDHSKQINETLSHTCPAASFKKCFLTSVEFNMHKVVNEDVMTINICCHFKKNTWNIIYWNAFNPESL